MVSIAVQDSEVEDRPTTLINPLLSCQMDMACGIEVGTSEWMGAMFNRTHLMAITVFQTKETARMAVDVACRTFGGVQWGDKSERGSQG